VGNASHSLAFGLPWELEAVAKAYFRGEHMPPFRNSASFGKRQEMVTFGELLRRGYDVYLTLVDDQQIDCIVRFDRNPGTFAAMEIRKPRPNFFFIFYSEAANCYWIMPSVDMVRLTTRNKTVKAAGRFRVSLQIPMLEAKFDRVQNGPRIRTDLIFLKTLRTHRDRLPV
jgi:hypothetical protein